ncbi:MAG TPA: zf-HC2 domain-containing protein [Methylomirabilota bacterium]|nr:zf-HC2 domain-containing protein [Methylomirabilota bacterium]
MERDPWTAKLSEYLDGELAANERAAVERHLAACPTCTAVLAELRAVAERARRLAAREPATDLWPGIARRLAPRPAVATGLEPRAGRRRWSFSLPELAAAALVLVAASGGAAWWLAERRPPVARPVPAVAPGPTPIPAAAEADYDRAVADLERVLAAGRGTLDTATVRVLERNLAIIDRAIADARRALAADPASAYLNAHLARTLRLKLDLLRRAAALAARS